MSLTPDDILGRIDGLVPGAAAAVLAEIALIEAVVLADRCAAHACDGKARFGICDHCPTDGSVFEAFLPDDPVDQG